MKLHLIYHQNIKLASMALKFHLNIIKSIFSCEVQLNTCTYVLSVCLSVCLSICLSVRFKTGFLPVWSLFDSL